ncbi:hypothetical protein JW979_15595 [bacterium]|nr:hypothetical protein [candidate division CSSED10-310 bacterium]
MNADDTCYIDLLINKCLIDIGRAANMAWLFFDSDREKQAVDKSGFLLHVQSPFRMIDMIDPEKSEVLFASLDMYLPNSENEQSLKFAGGVHGNNRYDEEAKKWLQENESVYVKKLHFNVLGDLRLLLSNGHVFEVRVTSSLDGEYDECWRFFERGSDRPHFVVNGKKTIHERAVDLNYKWE